MVSVPVLVTLTDRDRRQARLSVRRRLHGRWGICCSACWPTASGRRWRPRALTGIGWAGTYMTGLKLLADQVDAKLMSRAVTGHAASIGISGAAVLRAAATSRRACRLARGLRRGRRQRGARLAHRGAGRARAARRRRVRPGADRRCSISGRCCAIARRWPMRWPTASTRWR